MRSSGRSREARGRVKRARPPKVASDLFEQAAEWLIKLAGEEAENVNALAIASELQSLHARWEYGEFRTLDEALGWRRPANWNQAGAQARAQRWRVFQAVKRLRRAGSRTPDVFYQLAKDTKFGSASTIEKTYYKQLRLFSKSTRNV